jgi:hypothetical protein
MVDVNVDFHMAGLRFTGGATLKLFQDCHI